MVIATGIATGIDRIDRIYAINRIDGIDRIYRICRIYQINPTCHRAGHRAGHRDSYLSSVGVDFNNYWYENEVVEDEDKGVKISDIPVSSAGAPKPHEY